MEFRKGPASSGYKAWLPAGDLTASNHHLSEFNLARDQRAIGKGVLP